jgi:hypothetical protein
MTWGIGLKQRTRFNSRTSSSISSIARSISSVAQADLLGVIFCHKRQGSTFTDVSEAFESLWRVSSLQKLSVPSAVVVAAPDLTRVVLSVRALNVESC